MNNNSKMIDLKFILEITEQNNYEIKGFIDDVLALKNEVFNSLEQSLKNHDFKSIMEASHKLKSAVKIFGENNLVENLEKLEVASGDKDMVMVNYLVDEINKQMPDWVKQLEVEFEKL